MELIGRVVSLHIVFQCNLYIREVYIPTFLMMSSLTAEAPFCSVELLYRIKGSLLASAQNALENTRNIFTEAGIQSRKT